MRRLVSISAVLLVFGIVMSCPGWVQAQRCDAYLELIEKNLPSEVGSEDLVAGLLKVQSQDWASRANFELLFKTLGVSARGAQAKSLSRDNVGVLKTEEFTLRYNKYKGEFRFVNHKRGFNVEIPRAYDMNKGLELVKELVFAGLLLPDNELLLDRINAQVLKGDVALPGEIKPLNSYDIETTFFVPRVINGILVMDSLAAVGVSNRGEVANFRVRWPTMVIEPRTLKSKVLARNQMINQIHDRLMEEQGCEKNLRRFNMFIAYVPIETDIPDREKAPDYRTQIQYTPKLLVYFLPLGSEEGGNVMEFDLVRR